MNIEPIVSKIQLITNISNHKWKFSLAFEWNVELYNWSGDQRRIVFSTAWKAALRLKCAEINNLEDSQRSLHRIHRLCCQPMIKQE